MIPRSIPIPRVDDVDPGFGDDLIPRQPGELVPLAVEVVDRAIRTRGERDLRHRVREYPEPRVTLPRMASCRSASSARFQSVMSVLTPTMRIGRPVMSRTTVPLLNIHRTAPFEPAVRNSTSYGFAYSMASLTVEDHQPVVGVHRLEERR